MGTEPGLASTEQDAHAQNTVTLGTRCACGHPRKDHRGLSIDVKGACLECGCEEFTPPCAAESKDQMMTNVRAALDQVEGLQAIVASLRAQLIADDSHQVKNVRALRRYLPARSARSVRPRQRAHSPWHRP
jgi:hypothetical protein